MLDLAYRWLPAQRYSAIIGNIFGELPRGRFDGATKVALPQKRNHGAARVSGPRIIDYWLEAVTYFDPVFAFVRGYQQKDAAIILLTPDAQLLIKVHRVILDALPFQRMHSDNRHLGAGFLLQFGSERFESCFSIRLDGAGKVGDIAGRMNFLDVFGGRCVGKGKHQYQTKQCGES